LAKFSAPILVCEKGRGGFLATLCECVFDVVKS
jgi:hypothetical protein